MRTIAKIVGIGKRMQGTGKTGNSYDFTPVAITYDDRFITGKAAAMVNIDQSLFAEGKEIYVPYIGDELDVVMHQDQNRRLYVDAIIW